MAAVARREWAEKTSRSMPEARAPYKSEINISGAAANRDDFSIEEALMMKRSNSPSLPRAFPSMASNEARQITAPIKVLQDPLCEIRLARFCRLIIKV